MIRSVRLIYSDTGIGLTNDARILSASLQRQGVEVSQLVLPEGWGGNLALRSARRLASLCGDQHAPVIYGAVVALTRRLSRRAVDLNIFLERVFHSLLPTGRHNVLIPNPEWVDPVWHWQLRLVDAVWCKTRHAAALLGPYCRHARYIGFTSLDRAVGRHTEAPGGWLHVASAGRHKGTQAVLQAWHAHPHWPQLTVLQHKNPPLGASSGNVRYIGARINEL